MLKYDELRARKLASGTTIEQWVDELKLASELAVSGDFPISEKKLFEFGNQYPLALEIFMASMLDSTQKKEGGAK